jgi:hypothetical protein
MRWSSTCGWREDASAAKIRVAAAAVHAAAIYKGRLAVDEDHER